MHRVNKLSALILALLLTATWPNHSATAQNSTNDIDVNKIELRLLREVVEAKPDRNVLRLSLDRCLQIAIENNQDILVMSYEPMKSETDIMAAEGEFDPILSSSFNYLRSVISVSSDIARFGGIPNIENYNASGDVALGGKLRWGTMYSVAVALQEERTTFNDFVPEWSGALTFTLTQPLLRGRGKGSNLATIKIARNTLDMSDRQLKVTILQTLSTVVKAYWDLVGAIENMKVRQEALANAENLLKINERRLEIGSAAAIEVLQAKAGVAVRQSELISAQASVENAEDILKQLLNMRDNELFSATQIVPSNRPNVPDLRPVDVTMQEENIKKSINLALEHRPEMDIAGLQIDNANIELRRAGNYMLPQLDISGSAGQGGRGPKIGDVVSNYHDVFGSVASIPGGVGDRDNFTYTVGIRASIPIGNKTARATHTRAQLSVRQARQDLQKIKQQLMLNVRLASRSVLTSKILAESNRQTRMLQEANVSAEGKRLRLGVSTSYRVLEVQEDLTLAQTQEVQALVNYEKARVDLDEAQGTLLDTFGIEFVAPEQEGTLSFVSSIYPLTPKG